MTSAELVWESARTVAQDHNQFSIGGDQESMSDDLDTALDGRGESEGPISRVGSTLMVATPHQNNFALRLRVEVWTAEPVDDLPDWQMVLTSSLTVAFGGLEYGSPTMDPVLFDVPEGPYAVRISGAGLVAHGWPGSTEPGDWWRVQLWPTETDIRPAVVRDWDGRVSEELTRPAWAQPSQPTPTDDSDANPWTVLEPMLNRLKEAQYDLYSQGGNGYQLQSRLDKRWGDFDSRVIANVFLNLIREPQPLATWGVDEVALLRREFAALHEFAPTVLAEWSSFFALMDDIGQQVLSILAARIPHVAPAGTDTYPVEQIVTLPTAAHDLAATIRAGVGRGRKRTTIEGVTTYGRASPSALNQTWHDLADWITPSPHDAARRAQGDPDTVVVPIDRPAGERHAVQLHRPPRGPRNVADPDLDPKGLTLAWNWLPAADQPGGDGRVLPDATTVFISWKRQLDGVTRTTLTHDDVPPAWAATLLTFWHSVLAEAERHTTADA